MVVVVESYCYANDEELFWLKEISSPSYSVLTFAVVVLVTFS